MRHYHTRRRQSERVQPQVHVEVPQRDDSEYPERDGVQGTNYPEVDSETCPWLDEAYYDWKTRVRGPVQEHGLCRSWTWKATVGVYPCGRWEAGGDGGV